MSEMTSGTAPWVPLGFGLSEKGSTMIGKQSRLTKNMVLDLNRIDPNRNPKSEPRDRVVSCRVVLSMMGV